MQNFAPNPPLQVSAENPPALEEQPVEQSMTADRSPDLPPGPQSVPDAAETPEVRQRIKRTYAHCPACGHEFQTCEPNEALVYIAAPPPVYPMYDLKVAAELIPAGYRALVMFLGRHKQEFPPRYRLYTDALGLRRRVRVLSSREILAIRARSLRGIGRHTQ